MVFDKTQTQVNKERTLACHLSITSLMSCDKPLDFVTYTKRINKLIDTRNVLICSNTKYLEPQHEVGLSTSKKKRKT